MKTISLKSLVTLLTLSASVTIAAEKPAGWFPAGSKPKDYEMSVDRTVVHGGKASAHLKSLAALPSGFGTLMQTFAPREFAGKRVRLSGYVRAQNVSDWSGMWMRVDDAKGNTLAFDNMQTRAIKGSTDWKLCEIVLDVSAEAQSLSFGLLLSGAGQVWLDDLKFEVVGNEVPTTVKSDARPEPKAPVNLSFED